MNKYNTHSDLAKESLDLLKEGKHYKERLKKRRTFQLKRMNF